MSPPSSVIASRRCRAGGPQRSSSRNRARPPTRWPALRYCASQEPAHRCSRCREFVRTSTMARESQVVVHRPCAGPEIGVASTKAFTGAADGAGEPRRSPPRVARGTISAEPRKREHGAQPHRTLPTADLQAALALEGRRSRSIAKRAVQGASDVLYLGRGHDAIPIAHGRRPQAQGTELHPRRRPIRPAS